MNALELLKQDHQAVKKLFEQAEATEDEKEQQQIFKQIKKELETHTRIEETVFYPAMQKHEELKDMVLEAIEEHRQVKTLLKEMDDLVNGSEKFEPKLQVLMENVEHHAEEEEEGKMFPKVREIVDQAALEELGQELEAAKGKKSKAA
jgi:hemerythrin superfamily protein